MAEVAQRFFCHECSVEIPRVAADFTCPTCNSGFIEELPEDNPLQAGGGGNLGAGAEDEDFFNLLQLVGGHGGGAARGPAGGRRLVGLRGAPRHHIRIATRGGPGRPPGGPQNLGMDQAALETALQDFLGNLAGINMGGTGGAAPRFHFIGPGGGGLLGPGGGFHLHGNPGDYAWGQGGLDAIITQMLNHMDGAGPPPMTKENIQTIPTVKITPEQREKSQSCSICWEDFTDNEEVKMLECEHCFHSPCIVPWLELHGTCPVCRKELGGGREEGGGEVNTQAEEGGGEAVPGPNPPAPNSGGLTGLIQSALNQVFSSAWPSSQPAGTPQGTPPPSSSASTTSTAGTSISTPATSTTSATTSSSTFATESSSEDDTPAARRQRLDSEFVDLDFD